MCIRDSNTGFADHCLQHNHFIDTKNITLLHNIQKGKKMDLFEILEIRKQNDKFDSNIQGVIDECEQIKKANKI